MPRKMTMHAWDCDCSARNAPSLACCRSCGAPWERGRPILVEDEDTTPISWSWLWWILTPVVFFSVMSLVYGPFNVFLYTCVIGGMIFSGWPIWVFPLLILLFFRR